MPKFFWHRFFTDLSKGGFMDRKNTLEDTKYLKNDLNEKPAELTAAAERKTTEVFIERPLSTYPDTHPVNGNYAPDDDDDDDEVEEDLILGDEDEVSGDEEEFDVELEEDVDEVDIDEDDLVIDTDDDDDEDDDL
jgi:hypothetical protein